MRVHVTYHLLKSPGFVLEDTCGFCGLSCQTVLVKTSKSVEKPQSNCKRFYEFRLKNAEKLTKGNLSTNVPVKCPFCPDDAKTFVWKYSLPAHLEAHHPTSTLPEGLKVTSAEKTTLLKKNLNMMIFYAAWLLLSYSCTE